MLQRGVPLNTPLSSVHDSDKGHGTPPPTAGQRGANCFKLSPRSPDCKAFNLYLSVALLLTFISRECGCQHQFGVDCGETRFPLYTF